MLIPSSTGVNGVLAVDIHIVFSHNDLFAFIGENHSGCFYPYSISILVGSE